MSERRLVIRSIRLLNETVSLLITAMDVSDVLSREAYEEYLGHLEKAMQILENERKKLINQLKQKGDM